MTKTEEFLNYYNIKFYKNAEDRIIINQSVYLDVTRIDDDLFCNCTIEGSVDLDDVISIGARCFNDCHILGYFDLSRVYHIDKFSMQNCYIKRWLGLYNLKTFDKDLLLNSKIGGSIELDLKYLPKWFNLNVDECIHLPSLKSKILKELLLNPGPKRQLGFNLLKTLTKF